METISIINGHIYKFHADKLLTDRIYNQIHDLDFKPATSNSQTEDLYYDKELFDFFSTCIKKAANNLLLPKGLTFPITSCWVNKTKKLETHHTHTHANSFMSGIFYLTDHTNGGQTVFTSPNLWSENFKWMAFETSIFTPVHFTTSPKRGTLLLFPSCLQHKVSAVKDATRFSIAFNVFITGNFGNSTSKTFLNIKSQSVEDRIQEL